MSKAVVEILIKKISDLPNATCIEQIWFFFFFFFLILTTVLENADGLSLQKLVKSEVEWVGKTKQRLPPNKYRMSH